MTLKDVTLIQWLGIILVVNGALSGATSELTDLLGAIWAKHVASVAEIGSAIIGGVVMTFGGIGTQAKNVVDAGGHIKVGANAADALKSLANDVTQPAIEPTTVVRVLIAAFALSFLLAGVSPSHAQSLRLKPLTGDAAKDFNLKPVTNPSTPAGATATDNALASFNQEVQKITKDIVDKAIDDANAAITDATNHQDNISLPCWQANLKLFQGLPSQWPNPPTQPIGIMLGIQIQRDLLNAITGNDVTSLKVACAALWGDQLKIVANVGALLGIRIATGGLF